MEVNCFDGYRNYDRYLKDNQKIDWYKRIAVGSDLSLLYKELTLFVINSLYNKVYNEWFHCVGELTEDQVLVKMADGVCSEIK